jgi:hypothetical protein
MDQVFTCPACGRQTAYQPEEFELILRYKSDGGHCTYGRWGGRVPVPGPDPVHRPAHHPRHRLCREGLKEVRFRAVRCAGCGKEHEVPEVPEAT